MIGKTCLVSLILLLGVSIFGCTSDTLEGPGKTNQPPTVWLSGAPPEGTVSRYTLQLFWGGWDPDGEIAYYEYTVTDNDDGVFDPADTTGADKWHRVFRNDSIFVFTADEIADSTTITPKNLQPFDFVRSHTFFIRAVDDRGMASTRPDYRSFTARTLSPVVDILIPRPVGGTPAQVPPISTYKWVARDYISNMREELEPDSVRWIMVSTVDHENNFILTTEYIRKNPDAPEWSDWHFYRAPGDTGKTFTTQPLSFGSYVFAVQVKDEAGAVNPVFDENRNVRRVLVSTRLTGPLLSVFNKFIGSIVTQSPNTLPVIVDLPAKVPLSFRFSANASSYGGVVSGFRYGWDIQDLSDDSQWDIDYTPFVLFVDEVPTAESPPRTFEFDTHNFNVEVIDNNGFTSRVGVTVNVIPFSMQKNILIVDDWKEPAASFAQSGGAVPGDPEHDQFWIDMVIDSVADFDPAVDVIQIETDLAIDALADYRSIIWSANSSHQAVTTSFVNDLLRFVDPEEEVTGKSSPNIIALFMEAGGHVLLCGREIMTATLNRDSFRPRNPVFPLIFRYELMGNQTGEYPDQDIGVLGVGEESFPYEACCLNVLDMAYVPSNQLVRRPGIHGCAVSRIRTQSGRDDGLRTALPMDEKYSDMPALSLRPEVAGTGKWYTEERTGLACDIYNPPYFATVQKGGGQQGVCNDYAEIDPRRECFKPIYGNGCLNPSSKVYDAPVAFWTTAYENRVPEAGGFAARSAIFGFHLVYFNPEEVKRMMGIILIDEWKLPNKRP